LERVLADLNDASARRVIYECVGTEPALMITEGLLTYLPGELVRAIAGEPPTMCGVRYWLMDLASPAMAQAVGAVVHQLFKPEQAFELYNDLRKK